METIKIFTKEYLEECAKIYSSIFNKSPWNDNWTVDRAYHRLEEIYNTPKFMGIVCMDDEKIVGGILGNIETWDIGLKYSLKEFFVDNNLQGKGVGSSMIEFLENELKNINVKSIELYTLKNSITKGFYNKNGYKDSKDTIIMNKNL